MAIPREVGGSKCSEPSYQSYITIVSSIANSTLTKVKLRKCQICYYIEIIAQH